jgi:hypothetical protein
VWQLEKIAVFLFLNYFLENYGENRQFLQQMKIVANKTFVKIRQKRRNFEIFAKK